ncbi:MAG TPA: POTRA domain-containing protein [Bacteroidia bacterium]|nr:POTRA domain-containing protein [Bacteroidia bacterium]
MNFPLQFRLVIRKSILFLPLIFGLIFSGFLSAQDSIRPDSSLYVIRSISYSGNKQTKVFIMEREVSFKVGDTISGIEFQKRLKHSRENLLNTSLFNFVTIYSSCEKDSSFSGIIPASVSVVVRERWYTWPVPVFDVAEQNFNTWWRNGHNFQRASYGFFLWRYNFRGRKESIALICRFGYSQQFGGQYAVPYLNKKHTIGMVFTGTYTRNHEVSYATQNNKLVYYKDNDKRIRGETSGSIMFSYRKGVYWRQTLDFRYTNLSVNDTVTDLSPHYFAAGRNQMEYFTISYNVTRDYRDIKAYPLKGHFEEFEMTKHGLGILADEKLNIFAVAAGVRGYAEVLPRLYLAGMLRARWNPSKSVPYYHQRALGFGTYIRGYEYYVIDGESYAVAKTSVRYAILKPHIFKIPFLPLEKFNMFHLAIYGGVYADAGYVDDNFSVRSDRNFLGNSFLFGYGGGIDIVTYYDIALRLEYSFNLRNENGLFVHLGTAF